MAAEVDLDLGREPPQVETAVGPGTDERGLGMLHLGGDALHPCVVAVAEHDALPGSRETVPR